MPADYEIIAHCHLCDAENVPGVKSTTVRGAPAVYCQVCWEMSLSPVHSVGKATSVEHYIAVALSKLSRRLLYAEPTQTESSRPDPDAPCASCQFPYSQHAEAFGAPAGHINNCKRGYDGDPEGCGMCGGAYCPGPHAFTPREVK